MKTLFSLIESPTHPDFSVLYQQLEFQEIRFNTSRKLLKQLKKQQPDFIVAEFFYGYGNNYAGINISNLDVMLYSLQKYSPQTKVIVMVSKAEQQYVADLDQILPLHGVLVQPVKSDALALLLLNKVK